MVSIYLIVDIIAAIALIVLGLLVLTRNTKSKLNIVFFLFTLSLTAWIFTNYFSNDQSLDISTATLANHLVLFFADTSVFLFAWFVSLVSPVAKSLKKLTKYILIFGFAVSFSALTPLVMESIEKQEKVYAISFGVLGPVYFLSIVIGFGYSLLLLFMGMKKAKGQERDRLNIITLSIVGTIIVAVSTNVLIPLTSGSFALTNIGPLSTLFLAVGLAYSIIRHKLFDIRVFVAKALAYALSVTLLLFIFIAGTFAIAALLSNEQIPISTLAVLALVSVIGAITFQPIKVFFDKITNKFFYRDAYDGQALLNELNSSLVSNADIEPMLLDAANIISASLRPDFCTFNLIETESGNKYAIGTRAVRAADAEIRLISEITNEDEKTTITDNLQGHREAKVVLNKYRVELMTKLVVGEQTIGYLMLGARKSGSQYSQRDIQLLETAADSVAIAAQNALRFTEIAQFNVELEKKIEDATGKLQKSNEKLKALDEAKDEFISMASHQLRTPLTSVKGYISMILEGDAGKVNDQQRLFLDQAFISSQRMVYLIADLLNVSRLKTGKFVIEPKPTYLPDVIESEISQLYETAKARELKLIFNKPKEFPTLNLDEVKTRQVIMNFTDNAIYYTPKGGKITLDLKATKDMIEFTVHDTGIGVPKHEQHHLFTKFYRAGNARKARPDGTGLGLFMGKKVIVAQGGAILFSTEEGKGSTFGFTFPRAKLEVTAPDA